jgi:ribosomal protein S18 acetylase RimI-like enzyme
VQPRTRERIDEFWAQFLGCAPRPLSANDVTVMAHAGLGDYRGVYLLRRGDAVVLSVPAAFADLLREAVRGLRAAEVAEASFLTRALASAAGEVIGPTYLGYADGSSFVARGSDRVRLLGPADLPALERLREAVAREEWERGNLDPARPPIWGILESDSLLAAAGYETLLGSVAHLGVVTHPRHRGEGLGRAVASAAAERALERELILQWQTSEENRPALRIAERLGFERYASSLTVELDLRSAR